MASADWRFEGVGLRDEALAREILNIKDGGIGLNVKSYFRKRILDEKDRDSKALGIAILKECGATTDPSSQ